MWTRWKLLQRRRGTRVLLYHFSLFCDCYVCFSLEPLFFECCWWTPKIVRWFIVCPRLSNILSSSLFESACSFFNCFFIASFFCFVFVFFCFFPCVFHSSFYTSFDLWMFLFHWILFIGCRRNLLSFLLNASWSLVWNRHKLVCDEYF